LLHCHKIIQKDQKIRHSLSFPGITFFKFFSILNPRLKNRKKFGANVREKEITKVKRNFKDIHIFRAHRKHDHLRRPIPLRRHFASKLAGV
jgi:hypothetical protein